MANCTKCGCEIPEPVDKVKLQKEIDDLEVEKANILGTPDSELIQHGLHFLGIDRIQESIDYKKDKINKIK